MPEELQSWSDLSLSWICSTLEKFRFRHHVSIRSIFSLSGLVLLRPSTNPLVAQDDETKHVIVSERETIQPIDNQNQLQENKYAPTSKSKISVLPQGVDMRFNSSPLVGEEAILSEQTRTLGVQVRGEINSYSDEQHLQSGANIIRHTERQRKYPVKISKELSWKKYNYTETNNQLDCFGSKEPHNDENIRYSRHSECNEESQNREDFTNNAILRGLNNCSPQKDGKNSCRLTRGEGATHVAHWKNSRKIAFTLAEVLITLGIIGIVAALTIPTLINRYRGYVLEQQFKKSYSNLSQIVLNIKNETGVENLISTFAIMDTEYKFDLNLVNSFYNEFDKSIKFIEKLEKPYPITNYSATETSDINRGGDLPKAIFVLSDGSSIGRQIGGAGTSIRFWIDTNGPYKKPNRYGFDIFEFQIKDKTDKIQPLKAIKSDYTDEELENIDFPFIAGHPCSKNNKQQLNGIGCSWYAVNNINPDDNSKKYWDNLPW